MSIPTVRDKADQPDPEEPDFDREQRIEELQERYAFYLMNPAQHEGVNYSLWYLDEHGEFPIIQSNTGGFTTFNSRSTNFGDALDLTSEFFNLVAFGLHEAMCFMPDIYFRGDHFERLYESIYEGKPRKHEVWAAHTIIAWMAGDDEVIPELRPLVEWAADHTEMPVPVLESDPDE